MTDAALLLAFPFVPLFAAGAALAARTVARRDWSAPAVAASHALQTAIGLALIARFYRSSGEVRFPVSAWPYAIEFAFEHSRAHFLAAYLVPLLFSLARLRQLPSFHLRLLFLLYLGGCSGLLVTGDIFNFFVFYELMIMAAYVLVAARRKFYASVKYMLFGAASSSFLLGGIVLFYATGADLGFPFAAEFYAAPAAHQAWILVLFGTAFLVKSAFFPAYSWVATCHAATAPVVSAFLGSFTVFTGIFGLHQRVLRPAASLGLASVFDWLEVLSLLTMALPSAAIFFERDFKRCIAGSTVVTIGFVGLMLSRGWVEPALLYVAFHALYKSLLFHLTDDLRIEGTTVAGRPAALAALGVGVWMASGFYPALIWFLKYNVMDASPALRAVSLASSALVAGGFLKFRYVRSAGAPGSGLPAGGLFVLLLAFALFPFYRPAAGWKIALDLGALAATVAAAARLRRRADGWPGLGGFRLFANLNAELLAPLLLFVSGLAFVLARL